MTYQQTVLNSKPAGFWMITAPSGTSETDLSGNGKTATITEATDLIDRAYRPLVSGTSSDRAYRFYNTNHKITYPALEAWEINRDHIPFSVEFTVLPMTTPSEMILFAPQEASSTNPYNNTISIKDGLLRFTVSNGSAAGYDTKRSEVSSWLNYGQSYHIVAVYDISKIYLYVDGVLVDSDVKDTAIQFGHTTTNFVTQCQKVTTDTATSEVIFDALSFYRRALSPSEVNNHYVSSTPNVSDLDWVNSNNGKLIKFNDEDMQKTLEFSARTRGWRDSNNTLTDLVVDDQGCLSLRQIDPPKIVTGPEDSGNLLTWNQSSFEDNATTGWSASNVTIAIDTINMQSGLYSMKITPNGTNSFPRAQINTIGTMPRVTPGKTYSAYARAYSNVAQVQQIYLKLNFMDASGVSLGDVAPTGVTIGATSNATLSHLNRVAPYNAAYARLEIMWGNTPAATDIIWVDHIMIEEGNTGLYQSPSYNPTAPNTDISTRPYNLLSFTNAYLDTGFGDWIAGSNATRAHNTTNFFRGAGSVSATSVGAGNVQIYNSSFITTVKPGENYSLGFYSKAATVSRSVRVDAHFYNFSGTFISTSSPTTTANSTSAWTKHVGQVTVPSGAYSMRIGLLILSAAGASEVHYIDHAWVARGNVTDFVEPRFGNSGVNAISLHDSKALVIEDAGKFVGVSSGGIGGNFEVTALANDHIGEQVVATLSNSNRTQYFEIVKKTNKSLYLRYVYLNQAGVITTTETVWAALSGLLATTAYFYLEYSASGATLYINSTSSPAVIIFDAGIPQPAFDLGSFAVIGAGVNRGRTWENHFNWIKLYGQAQPIEQFTANKTSTNGYTLKGTNTLSVSQRAEANLVVASQNDGIDTITADAAYWTPNVPDITITATNSGANNLLKYAASVVETTSDYGVFQGTAGLTGSGQDEGQAALTATATTANVMNVETTNNAATRVSVYPGKTYTAYVRATSASVGTATIGVGFWWLDAAGAQISAVNSTPVTLNTGAYQTFTYSAVAPATAVYAQTLVVLRGTFAIGSIFYLDKFGLWEGSGTTWGQGYQALNYGSEILGDGFLGVPPAAYYVRAVLTTDDSKYRVTSLQDIELYNYQTSSIFAENSLDQVVNITNRDRTYRNRKPVIRQDVYSGLHAGIWVGRPLIYPVDDSGTTAVPDGGASGSTAGPARNVKTIEKWIYPVSEGYYFYYDGPTEYSLRYLNSGGFTSTGFTKLYVDNVDTANGVTSTTWYNRWHHIVLVSTTNINLATGDPETSNLLSKNASTIETSAVGWVPADGNPTIARSTAQAAQGSASMALTTTASGLQAAASIPRIQCNAGDLFTVICSFRSAAVPVSARIYVPTFKAGGGNITSPNSSPVTTTTSTWQEISYNYTAPTGAAQFDVRPAFTAVGSSEVHYFDKVGIFKGHNKSWVAGNDSAWLNTAPGSGAQAVARYQNLAYYAAQWTAGDVTASYEAYLGNVTGGAVTDSGSRTVTDSSGTNPKTFAKVWEIQAVPVR